MSAGVVVSLCCQSKRSRDHRTLLPHTVVASNLSLQRSPPINTGLVGDQSRMEAPRAHASIFPVSSCTIELQLWQRECSVLVMNNTKEAAIVATSVSLITQQWLQIKVYVYHGEERRGEHNLSRAEVLGDLCSRHKMLPSLVLLFIRTSFPVCCDLLFCSRRSLLLSCFFSWGVGRERSTLNMAVRIETIAGGFGSTRTLTLQKPMRAHGSVHEPPLRCLTWNSEGGIHRNHDHRSSSSRLLLSVPRKYTAVDLFAWGTPAHCHCCSLCESAPSNALPLLSSHLIYPTKPQPARGFQELVLRSSFDRPMSWSRVADLETKLSKAQEELKKLRDQLGSAEVAKVDAEQALEKAKKQVFTVNRNAELDKRKSPPQESEPAPEPKPQTAPNSEVEDVSSPTASDVSKLVVPMEPLDQIKHEEEAEKEKDEQNMETIMQKDDDNNNGGGVEERNELVAIPMLHLYDSVFLVDWLSWQLSRVTAAAAAARQAAVAAEKVPVNVDAVNRSYVTLGSFSWDQDNDKIKVGPSFVVSVESLHFMDVSFSQQKQGLTYQSVLAYRDYLGTGWYPYWVVHSVFAIFNFVTWVSLQNMYEEGDDEMKRTIAKAWSDARSGKAADPLKSYP
ncbi:hypothetical protein B296_00025454 [Ensete ventricosum]|uniref:Uncharacterized protein n=1 Tax=Ensete ventricosum TaxID=4639 RepID=A0A427AT07_ENSVE|nr:hypothetical protein B296_00025454 [Ensete ventricosum]